MSTTQSIIDFLLDQLADCGAVTARKMFGEYCLYDAGRPVGLVCDNQLFLKNTVQGRGLMLEAMRLATTLKRHTNNHLIQPWNYLYF